MKTNGKIMSYVKACVLLLIVTILLLPTTPALFTDAQKNKGDTRSTLIFSDDFNDGDLAGWTITTQGSGLIQISGSQYHSAPYSMRMYSPSGTSSLAMATNQVVFNPATTDYNVSFYFRLTSSSNHWFDVFVNTPQILTVIDTGTDFKYRYGTQNILIMTLNQNQWYHIQYVVNVAQSNYGIYVDGVYKATAPFCGGSGDPQTFTIGDFESGSANYGEAFWDDFLIISLVMSDDFNDNNLDGWTVTTQGSGIVQTSAAQYVSSPYSMRMYSPTSPASKAMATYTMSTLDITKNYNVSFYFRIPTTTHHWFDVFTNPPQTTTVIDTSYQFIYRTGGNNFLIMTLTPNTWYRMDYYVHPSQQTYDIYVNNQFKVTAPFNGESGNPQTFRIGDLEYGTSNYGEGFWDDFVVIQAVPNQPPNSPSNPSPSDGATGVDINTDLSWTCTDPDAGDTLKYDVYFGTTNPPTTKVSANQTGTTYDPGTMNYSTIYYWQIISWDNHGAFTVGAVWSFTTELLPSPTQVTDITPWHTWTEDMYKGTGGYPGKYPGQNYTYQSNSTETGNDLYFMFYWGDTTNTVVGPISGGSASATHAYALYGYYNITVTVKHGPSGTESNPSTARQVKMFKSGDTNNDGFVSWRDIDPFVTAMNGKAAYYAAFPTGYFYAGDCNFDHYVSWRDIDPFVSYMNT